MPGLWVFHRLLCSPDICLTGWYVVNHPTLLASSVCVCVCVSGGVRYATCCHHFILASENESVYVRVHLCEKKCVPHNTSYYTHMYVLIHTQVLHTHDKEYNGLTHVLIHITRASDPQR